MQHVVVRRADTGEQVSRTALVIALLAGAGLVAVREFATPRAPNFTISLPPAMPGSATPPKPLSRSAIFPDAVSDFAPRSATRAARETEAVGGIVDAPFDRLKPRRARFTTGHHAPDRPHGPISEPAPIVADDAGAPTPPPVTAEERIADLSDHRAAPAPPPPVADVGALSGPIELVRSSDPVVAGPSTPPGLAGPVFDLSTGFGSGSPAPRAAIAPTATGPLVAEPARRPRLQAEDIAPAPTTKALSAPPSDQAGKSRRAPRPGAPIGQAARPESSGGRASVAHVDRRPDPGAAPPPMADAGRSIAGIVQTDDGIRFQVAAIINDTPGGRVSILIPDADQDHPEVVGNRMAVRVGDILQLLESRMDPAMFAEMSSSSHAEDYVTFGAMRAHGISVSFDRHDRLVLKAI